MFTEHKLTWLFLAANASRNAHLEIDEEFRLLREKLLRSKHRDRFDIHMVPAARPSDLQEELQCLRPTIVHFSGHGSGSSWSGTAHRETKPKALGSAPAGIVMCSDEVGETTLVEAEALRHVFELCGDCVRIVAFNSCHSHSLAKTVCSSVDFATGVVGAIRDEAARAFAVDFHFGLAQGMTVAQSHQLGIGALKLRNFTEDIERPRLLHRDGKDPGQECIFSSWRTPDRLPATPRGILTACNATERAPIPATPHSRISKSDIKRLQLILHTTGFRTSITEIIAEKDYRALSALARRAIIAGHHDLLAPLQVLEDALVLDEWPLSLPQFALSLDSHSESTRISMSSSDLGIEQPQVIIVSGNTRTTVELHRGAVLELESSNGRMQISVRATRDNALRGKLTMIWHNMKAIFRRLAPINTGHLGPLDDEVYLLDEEIAISES